MIHTIMSSPPKDSTAADAPNCCVVQLEFKNGRRIPTPDAGGLSPAVIAELIDATASWRDAKYVIKRLESLREREKLPGLALWYAHPKHATDVPAPLDVPFEPYELDEGRAPLAELVGSTSSADPDELAALRTSRIKRMMARLGLPVIILAAQLPNAITQLAVHRNLFVLWLWGAMLVCGIATAVIIWWLSDQWLIVPGGVVIRKSMVGKVGESLKLYTPADSTLIVRPQQSINSLELWRGTHVKRRLATKLECAALLAAWQSHIPPPDPDRLSDLG